MLETYLKLQDRIRNDDGAVATEYIILIVVIALVVIAGAALLGGALNTAFTDAASEVVVVPGD